jgi:hypothetical protein
VPVANDELAGVFQAIADEQRSRGASGGVEVAHP